MLPFDLPGIFSWAETTERVSLCLLTQSVSQRDTWGLPRWAENQVRGSWKSHGHFGSWSKTRSPGNLFSLWPEFSLLTQGDLVAVGVLSGNRNFEGRVHPNTRANYLASPPLVIAYAIAGTIRIDFEKEPLGKILFMRLQSFFQWIQKYYRKKVTTLCNKQWGENFQRWDERRVFSLCPNTQLRHNWNK